MKSWKMNIIKYILFILSMIYAISGVCIILLGILILLAVNKYNYPMEGWIIALIVTFIVTGSIVFAIASLGCYAAIKERYLLLIGFMAGLLIMLMIKINVGEMMMIGLADDISIQIEESKIWSLEDTEVGKQAWDNLQKILKCCGTNGPDDYSPINGYMSKFPTSCCINTHVTCQINSPSVYTNGCFSRLKRVINTILINLSIELAFFEVVSCILIRYLTKAIKKETESENDELNTAPLLFDSPPMEIINAIEL